MSTCASASPESFDPESCSYNGHPESFLKGKGLPLFSNRHHFIPRKEDGRLCQKDAEEDRRVRCQNPI